MTDFVSSSISKTTGFRYRIKKDQKPLDLLRLLSFSQLFVFKRNDNRLTMIATLERRRTNRVELPAIMPSYPSPELPR